jgi:O-antigen ligase
MNNKWLNTAREFMVLAYIATMPFKPAINNFFFILLLLFIIPKFDLKALLSFVKGSRGFQLIVIYLGILFFSVLWSSDRQTAFVELTRRSPMLLCPIAFASFLKHVALSKVKRVYIIVWTLAALFSVISTWFLFGFSVEDWKYFSYRLTETIELGANYYALFVSIAFFFLFEQILEAKTRTMFWIGFPLLFFLFLFLGLLSSRTAFFATCLACLLIPWIVLRDRTGIKIVIFFACLVVILATFLSIPYLRNRTLQPISMDSSKSQRIQTITAGLEIFSSSPIFGVGIGDVQQHLLLKYASMGFQAGIEENLNVHNEYLNTAIAGGVLALVAFLLIGAYSFHAAFNSGNISLIGFSVLFFAVCFTEVVLGRNKGVVFFSFFYSLFLIAREKNKNIAC